MWRPSAVAVAAAMRSPLVALGLEQVLAVAAVVMLGSMYLLQVVIILFQLERVVVLLLLAVIPQ